MNNFKIFVVFRQDSFTKHNAVGELKGEITVTTDRCDIEPILAGLNVQSYQIIGCQRNGIEVKCQHMDSMMKIPEHYYERQATTRRVGDPTEQLKGEVKLCQR